MRIFPAIDLRNGKCVNLIQGRADAETIFSEDPISVAESWADQGAEYLHLVDLDGAFEGDSANLSIVKEIVQRISIPTQLGGGIRDMERIEHILGLGVSRLILGTAALRNWELVQDAATKYPKQIVVGIDATNGLVATEGWVNISERQATEFAREMTSLGVETIIYTDITSDGMLAGPNVEATAEIITSLDSSIEVVASGGVTTLDDLKNLKAIGSAGAIIGRALYTQQLDLQLAINTVRNSIRLP
ncbi:1-(5-phosphoribosyl)-5-[(5-phosphoribosylamino)methylideneamino]imidazole-4-carboxamide isomerase [Candidatus Poribacteria bacterium]|nr:1-(5-phosphoribosyl)-5-[(5-phosphoribosylamino)methylideneamino]imidazole-4-carboxamide isomerase [Candidatus Poribacteria bacterium]MEE2910115.1 1-(5-phosphoribosyl)-5-[(5-phosphoribosylamino)methylideneamino]imidazole-4-carboxamide isomerase [Candidatus Poribacteria bacterium]